MGELPRDSVWKRLATTCGALMDTNQPLLEMRRPALSLEFTPTLVVEVS